MHAFGERQPSGHVKRVVAVLGREDGGQKRGRNQREPRACERRPPDPSRAAEDDRRRPRGNHRDHDRCDKQRGA